MAYIFGDLKTKLQTEIGDPNMDTTVIGDALNHTEQHIFGTFDLTLNSATQANSVTVDTNTLASAMPTDFQRITSLYISSPASYAKDITGGFKSIRDFRKEFPSAGTSSGDVTYWTYFTSIIFANLAVATLTVNLDYIKTVPFMSGASDVPTIPQSFEELLILGAKIRIYEQKEDFDYASQFVNRYSDLLEAFVARYSTRQVDTQIVIPSSRNRV